jgi:AcrR family transcriptional regulator
MRIADADGEQAVTMRRVAKELGSSTPMSLYRYVGSKDGIVDLMIDEVFGEIDLPDRPSGDWREDLRTLARRSRVALRRHPWFATLSHQRPLFGPHALRHNEWSLSALDGPGLPIGAAMSVAAMVFGYALSIAQSEAEEDRMRRRVGLTTDAQLRDAAAPFIERITADGRYPHLTRWITEGAQLAPDEQFELGLECLLDGIAHRIVRAG